MPERARDRYFDTVTLSNFALVHRLDLLTARYGRRLRITQEVLDEISDGLAAGFAVLGEIEAAVHAGTFRVAGALTSAERRTFQDLLHALAPGESSCVACAQARGGVVVTDDRVARERCAEQGVPFTGTIGILKACCRSGALAPPEADAVLRVMTDAGYHSPVRRISDLL